MVSAVLGAGCVWAGQVRCALPACAAEGRKQKAESRKQKARGQPSAHRRLCPQGLAGTTPLLSRGGSAPREPLLAGGALLGNLKGSHSPSIYILSLFLQLFCCGRCLGRDKVRRYQARELVLASKGGWRISREVLQGLPQQHVRTLASESKQQ